MGVAMSGGGIRSATFNLGLLQALSRYGLFSHADYLSTVSGGGYLGSAISSLCATAPKPEDVAIVVSGVPLSGRLSAGVQTVDGCWRLSRNDLDGLRLMVPSGGALDIRLTAHATLVEGALDQDLRADLLRVILRPAGAVPDGFSCVADRRDDCQGLHVTRTGESSGALDLPLHIHTEAFPFNHQPGVKEGDAFHHLRDSSNYLVPREFLAGLRLPALFLRGLMINLLIILPLVVVAALTTLWVSSGSLREAMDTDEVTLTLDSKVEPWLSEAKPGKYVVDLAGVIDARAVGYSGPRPDRVAVVQIARGLDVEGKTARDPHGVVVAVAEHPRLNVTVTDGAELPAEITLRLWRESGDSITPATMDPISALLDRTLQWVRSGTLAFLALLALYPLLEWLSRQRGRPSWRTRDIVTRYGAGGALMAILLTTLILSQPLAIYYYHEFSSIKLLSLGDAGEVMTTIWTALTALGVLFSGSLAERSAGIRGRIALQVLGAMGPVVIWLFYLNICRWALVPETAPDWLLSAGLALDVARHSTHGGLLGEAGAVMNSIGYWLGDAFRWADDGSEWLPHSERITIVYGLVAVLIAVVTQFFYDVNASSFHGFYRDRLSKAYLFNIWRPYANGKPRQNDRQSLSGLDDRRAPYHLVNTTMNVQHSKTANMRGRNGSNVVMSKAYVGGQLTGYRETQEMEELHPALDLGTAMAISAAAAAPNMGSLTIKGLTFALTLLNVRLGYWLPHPNAYSGAWYRKPFIGRLSRLLMHPFLRVTPRHLLKEMVGALSEGGLHVNLTDGGHLENMGLTELLRRRCRVVIVCDAEADPDMCFQGFADAVRMARIDLGVTIEIDIDPLRLAGTSSVSQSHAAVGRINYGDDEFGYLLYFKSTLTGDENVYVEKYLAKDATFPHQTTADQFFDEEQFEAYRSLGYHVAESVLRRHLVMDPFARDLDGLVDNLRKLKGVALV
ncbi:hypothetical protein NYP16_04310 [Alphaproteobacteria bacterium LMG 31809]|uniref:PNPLA domain-containing protein n=2 Tax=Govanella unica TaxID=2975056 RepID=A0A9X3TX18_9PROT|nr:hypothetical protein [Govania unica]